MMTLSEQLAATGLILVVPAFIALLVILFVSSRWTITIGSTIIVSCIGFFIAAVWVA